MGIKATISSITKNPENVNRIDKSEIIKHEIQYASHTREENRPVRCLSDVHRQLIVAA